MTSNIAIYAPTAQFASSEKLQEFAQDGKITQSSGEVQSVKIEWDTTSIMLNIMPQSQIQQHLLGLIGFAQQMGATTEIIQKLSKTQQVLGFVIEGGVDDKGYLKNFVLGLTQYYDGLFFVQNAIYRANNTLAVGMPNTRKQFFPPDLAQETTLSIARKTRSIERLKKEGVPYIDHLPVIEDEQSVQFRSKEEIVYRAICLAIVASQASKTGGIEMAQSLVKQYGVEAYLSPNERIFLQQTQPDQNIRVRMSWRYESCHLLLWSICFIDSLKRPEEPCDVGELIDIIKMRSIEQLLTQANVRNKSTLLDNTFANYAAGGRI